ncbi:MAG: cbb3-type cytochrome oxidase assembly protein CcoS [Chlorobi bacterium]|nr:cbb3-type cytochrome oxidase assembly protein CcoS [Chlorobiota bacterium]
MVVLFILIGLSLIVALIFLFLYIWSVKDGQYDDGHTPAIRILFDDNEIEKNTEETNTTKINSETN